MCGMGLWIFPIKQNNKARGELRRRAVASRYRVRHMSFDAIFEALFEAVLKCAVGCAGPCAALCWAA